MEQRIAAAFGGVANLHAVVEHGDTIQREHQGRCGQRAMVAEQSGGAIFVVIIGELHVERAGLEFRILLFPSGPET